ncbi:MAG: hypothetical protein KDA25_06570 [Phycisphaerales bacterium]|nr:hypothetical protein [Phycisphaerales bacterium]
MRPHMRTSMLLLVLVGLVGWTAGAAVAPLDDAFTTLRTYRFGDVRAPLGAIHRAVLGAMDDPAAAAALEARLLAVAADSGASLAARSFACREVRLVGTDAAVPVLAGLLGTPDLREMARYALAVIPGEDARRALVGDEVDHLLRAASAGGEAARTRLDTMNAPGVDRGLILAAGSDDDTVALLAIELLGQRGATAAREVLEAVGQRGTSADRRAAAHLALSRLADWRTDVDHAALLGAAMREATSVAVRRDALAAVSALGDPDLLPLVLDRVADPDLGADAAAIAIDLAMRLDDRDASRRAVGAVLEARPRDDEATRRVAGDAIARLDAREGFITAWLVAGPYPAEAASGGMHAFAFPPERAGGFDGWAPVPPATIRDPGIVDLLKVYGGDHRCAYARTIVHASAAQTVRLELGSDDGVRVWLNDVLVHDRDVARGFTLNEDVVVLPLRAGDNVLMLKITQGSGDWQFGARLRAADGFPIHDVAVRATDAR